MGLSNKPTGMYDAFPTMNAMQSVHMNMGVWFKENGLQLCNQVWKSNGKPQYQTGDQL